MRKLNIKLLSTVSALAFVVMGAAARADGAIESILDLSLDADNWYAVVNWNEQNSEAAIGAAIVGANQVAMSYAVQLGGSAAFDFFAGDEVTVDQAYWVDADYSSYADTPYAFSEADGGGYYANNDLNFGLAMINANSISANTTIKDALVEDIGQTAYTTFQTASLNVDGDDSPSGVTTINIAQYVDGQAADGLDSLDSGYDPENATWENRHVAYTFELVSRNEIDASASWQGTAIIDGGLTEDLENPDEFISGAQQAVVTMNTIAVSADDGENVVVNLGGGDLIDLNTYLDSTEYHGGQGFDVQGASAGEGEWNTDQINEDPTDFEYEQFTLEATNWAGAYAPHALTNSDPAILNLDQKAFVTANTITVGNAVANDGTASEDYGTADFTIMATIADYTEDTGYMLGQFANFNSNNGNLATLLNDDMGYDDAASDGFANWMSEVKVRNTVIATTILEDYWEEAGGADVAGVDAYYDANQEYNDRINNSLNYTADYLSDDNGSLVGGLDEGVEYLNDRDYDVGYGDVALTNVSQMASFGVNAISNIGSGDLKLISGEDFDPENANNVDLTDFNKALSFVQSVDNFEYNSGTVSVDSSFDNGYSNYDDTYDPENPLDFGYDAGIDDSYTGPDGFINTAYASTDIGDVAVVGLEQTASFAFNSIRSVGDILGWTNVDSESTDLDSEDYDAGIAQISDTTFFMASEYGNEDGMNGMELSTNDGNIDGTDLTQVTSITTNTMSSNGNIISDILQAAEGAWYIEEPNDLDLSSDGGATTGGNLSQTALFTANSITTSDLFAFDADGEVLTDGDGNDVIVFDGGDLVAAFVTQDVSQLALDYSSEVRNGYLNEVEIYGDTVDVGQISQAMQVSLNQIDVEGDILIGAYGDEENDSLLSQIGTYEEIGINNDISADGDNGVKLAGSATEVDGETPYIGVQAAYLNVNSIAAGELLSGNVDQDLGIVDEEEFKSTDYYATNVIDAYTTAGLAQVSNFTQSAAINLNTITAGTYEGANINQHIADGLALSIVNVTSAISDIGSGKIENITQQAITRINTIGG